MQQLVLGFLALRPELAARATGISRVLSAEAPKLILVPAEMVAGEQAEALVASKAEVSLVAAVLVAVGVGEPPLR